MIYFFLAHIYPKGFVWLSLEIMLYVNALGLLTKLNPYYLTYSALSGIFIHIPENVWNYLLRLATNALKRTAFIIGKIILLGSALPDASSFQEGFCFTNSST